MIVELVHVSFSHFRVSGGTLCHALLTCLGAGYYLSSDNLSLGIVTFWSGIQRIPVQYYEISTVVNTDVLPSTAGIMSPVGEGGRVCTHLLLTLVETELSHPEGSGIWRTGHMLFWEGHLVLSHAVWFCFGSRAIGATPPPTVTRHGYSLMLGFVGATK